MVEYPHIITSYLPGGLVRSKIARKSFLSPCTLYGVTDGRKRWHWLKQANAQKNKKKLYRISDLQIIKWRFIACDMKCALYFPGFLSAQMRAPCPPMEWPEMDIFSGSAGKLELISRGSWEQEKEDEDECMRQCLRCQCFIFNCNHLQSITFPSE